MANFIQALIQGVAMGSLYGLIAIGYVLIYNAWGILNFAQGDMVMVGAFAVYVTHMRFGLPMWLAIPAALVICMVIGFLIEVTAFRPLIDAIQQRRLIATIGIGIFLRNLVRVVFGADPYFFPPIFDNTPHKVGALTIVPQNIWNMVIGFLLIGALTVFLKRTTLGKSMRATAQDREAARLMGINVKRSMSLTFIIASALGGLAGMLICPVFYVVPTLGSSMGNKGFSSALFGGITSDAGSMVGGIVLGLLEAIGATTISSAFQSSIAYAVLFLVLIFMPNGLFGKNESRKV